MEYDIRNHDRSQHGPLHICEYLPAPACITRTEGWLKPEFRSTQAQVGRRYRQVRDLWRVEGASGITLRMRRAAAELLSPEESALPVRHADVMAADISHPIQPAVPQLALGAPLTINWVTTPPSPGSGGHTTLFRMVRYLESQGCRNRIYFYDVYNGDHRYYESVVREYYKFHGPVTNVDKGMDDAHAVIATGWPTAYPVFNSRCAGKRFYFVQDYEPHFHPVGAVSLLAENTYRMGFHAITAGKWLATKLRAEFCMAAQSFDFGCDTQVYRCDPNAKRSGVVAYVRRGASRRALEIALVTIEIFATRRPDIDVHLYGDTMGKLPFRFINHGRVGPEQLNRIYNQCYAGLSLSLTNVSLVPHEMLAAGCIPVVNDAPQNRLVLDNEHVVYVSPHPHALASTLETLVTTADVESRAQSAAASVQRATWDDAGAEVERILREALRETLKTRVSERALV
jgi:glycosyltransferase involved in cell wall biosynthesis